MNNKPIKVRGSWFGINPVTKTTPTKKEKVKRIENKHKGRRDWKDHVHIA